MTDKLLNPKTGEIVEIRKLSLEGINDLLVEVNTYLKKVETVKKALRQHMIDNNIEELPNFKLSKQYRLTLDKKMLPDDILHEVKELEDKLQSIKEGYGVQQEVLVLKPKMI